MTGVNLELIRARSREIREAIQKMRHYVQQDTAAFMADERNLYTVMHLLLICIEAAASLCNHLVAKTASAAPGSFSDCFEALRDLGVVDQELAARLVRMARFRNVLVHRYWDVRADRILEYARGDLGDFEAFLDRVGRWVQENVRED